MNCNARHADTAETALKRREERAVFSPPPPCCTDAPVKGICRPAEAVLAVWAAFLAAIAPGGVRADTPWVEESISTHATGSWSRPVLYNRTTGLAPMNGEKYVYTPNVPSTGDYVTVQMRVTFPEPNGDAGLDAGTQAGLRIVSSGTFQVWAKGGWLNVAAQGITPAFGVEYAFSFVFDYVGGTYSVAVQEPGGSWRRLASARGLQAFPLAAKGRKVEAIVFDGKADFRSLKGSQIPERPAAAVWGASGIWKEPNDSRLRPPKSGWSQPNSLWGPPESGWGQTTVVWGRRNFGGACDGGFWGRRNFDGVNQQAFCQQRKTEGVKNEH